MYSKCVPRVVINNVLASTSGKERHRTKCTVVFVAVSIGHLDSESIAFVTSTNYVPGNRQRSTNMSAPCVIDC